MHADSNPDESSKGHTSADHTSVATAQESMPTVHLQASPWHKRRKKPKRQMGAHRLPKHVPEDPPVPSDGILVVPETQDPYAESSYMPDTRPEADGSSSVQHAATGSGYKLGNDADAAPKLGTPNGAHRQAASGLMPPPPPRLSTGKVRPAPATACTINKPAAEASHSPASSPAAAAANRQPETAAGAMSLDQLAQEARRKRQRARLASDKSASKAGSSVKGTSAPEAALAEGPSTAIRDESAAQDEQPGSSHTPMQTSVTCTRHLQGDLSALQGQVTAARRMHPAERTPPRPLAADMQAGHEQADVSQPPAPLPQPVRSGAEPTASEAVHAPADNEQKRSGACLQCMPLPFNYTTIQLKLLLRRMSMFARRAHYTCNMSLPGAKALLYFHSMGHS